MKKITIATFIYEDSGGTKKVIDDLKEKYENLGLDVDIVAICSPLNKIHIDIDKQKDIAYLNSQNELRIMDTISNFQKIIVSRSPDRVFFILGNWFMLFLANCISEDKKKLSVLYFLDPWFTFGSLKNKIHQLASKFIKLRTSINSHKQSKNLYDIFGKIKSLEEVVNLESQNLKSFQDFLGIIVCSNDMFRFFYKDIGIPKEKILLLPLYVNRLDILLDPISKTKKSTFIYAARATSSWKGFWLVLEAIKIIKNAKLEIYTWDNSEDLFIKKLLKHYKLDFSRVKIKVGLSTRDFAQIMRDATAVIIPSIAEGFSFAMLESMMVNGITVVGALFGGPKDVIKDGYNGFVFEPGDSKSLAIKLQQVIDLDPSENIEVRNKAHQIAKTYTFDKYWLKLNGKFKIT